MGLFAVAKTHVVDSPSLGYFDANGDPLSGAETCMLCLRPKHVHVWCLSCPVCGTSWTAEMPSWMPKGAVPVHRSFEKARFGRVCPGSGIAARPILVVLDL